jgi:hypothetical protein
MRIIKNEILNEKFYRFDLLIEGTHNFLCNGIVVHNTSTSIVWMFEQKHIHFNCGGLDNTQFTALFNAEHLKAKFLEIFPDQDVRIYGEGYGGKQQGMSHIYGKELKFVGFDVKVGSVWLNVPNAEDVCKQFGLEFVAYDIIDTALESLTVHRELPSVQAKRNGCGDDKKREGDVLRPLIEMRTNNGERVIAKYKPTEKMETRTKREVSDEMLQVLADAEDIAEEWTVNLRLEHVLQHFPADVNMESMGDIVKAMIADIYREGRHEIIESKAVEKAIGRKTVQLFKQKLVNRMK